MGKNDMIRRINDARKEGITVGQLIGQQQAFDAVLIWLHRQGWGTDRLKRMHAGMMKVLGEYEDAFFPRMEQDVLQERMDAEICDALKGEKIASFRERYPMVKNAGYDKLPKR